LNDLDDTDTFGRSDIRTFFGWAPLPKISGHWYPDAIMDDDDEVHLFLSGRLTTIDEEETINVVITLEINEEGFRFAQTNPRYVVKLELASRSPAPVEYRFLTVERVWN